MTIMEFDIDLKRWLPSKEDYEAGFYDEEEKQEYEEMHGPSKAYGEGEFDHALLPKLRVWGRIFEPHRFDIDELTFEDMKNRPKGSLRMQLYHSTGDKSFDTQTSEWLYYDQKLVRGFINTMPMELRKKLHDKKLRIMTEDFSGASSSSRPDFEVKDKEDYDEFDSEEASKQKKKRPRSSGSVTSK